MSYRYHDIKLHALYCDGRCYLYYLPHRWLAFHLAVFVRATYFNLWSIKQLLISTHVSGSTFFTRKMDVQTSCCHFHHWGGLLIWYFAYKARKLCKSKSTRPAKMKISSCLWCHRSPSLCSSGSSPWTPTSTTSSSSSQTALHNRVLAKSAVDFSPA